MKLSFQVLLFFAVFSASAFAEKKSNERLVLSTAAGDLVLRFYPEVAPRHVKQILDLAAAGVYDGTHFYRLENGFVLQLGDAIDRVKPLELSQTRLIRNIPAEFSKIPYTRGVLSMARYEDNPDSASTSFSIMLGDAPHLNEKYTVFGYLEKGWDVLAELEKAPSDSRHQPLARLEVYRASVLKNDRQLSETFIRPAIPLPKLSAIPLHEPTTDVTLSNLSSLWLAGGLVFFGMLIFFGASYFSTRVQAAIGLIAILAGMTALLIVLEPLRKVSTTIAGVLLLSLFAVFRLLGQFESSPKKGH